MIILKYFMHAEMHIK